MAFLSGKNILIISPEPWDFIFVSKHHYSIELAKHNNQVFFLNPPLPNKKAITIDPSGIKNLHIINYSIPIRGSKYLPFLIRHLMNILFIKKIEVLANIKINVLVNFENSRFFDLNLNQEKIFTIYFQVDQNQNFNPEKSARSADIVLAINDEIKALLEEHVNTVHKLPHAFHPHDTNIPNSMTQHKKKNFTAGYIGNLDNYYLDVELLDTVIKENNHVTFKLIGPYEKNSTFYRKIHKYQNVTFTGKIEWNDLPNHLLDIDVFTLTYKKNFWYSSHKILEYLATGKPVVSTYLDEYKGTGLLEMTDNDKYPQLFSQVVENYAEYVKAEDIQKRISFAQQNTYSARVDQLNELINRHRKTHV